MNNPDSILLSQGYQGTIAECLIISILATLAMTIFGIFISYFYKKDFKEPFLLGKIFQNHVKDSPNWFATSVGYAIHFIVGFIFTSIQLYLYLLFAPVWYSAVIIGLLHGVIACIIWYLTIMIYKDVIFVKVGNFLYQLIFAHVIFALVVMLMYILPRLEQL